MAGSLYLGNQKVCPAILIGEPKIFNVNGSQWLGEIDSDGVMSTPTQDLDFVFNGVKDIQTNFLSGLLTTSAKARITSVSFPDLENLSGRNALYSAFRHNSSKVSSFSAPKLKTITGEDALRTCFWYSKIEELSLPELEDIRNLAFEGCFAYSLLLRTARFNKLNKIGFYSFFECFSSCQNVDLYFNSIKSDTFVDDTGFVDMLSGATNCTIHVPSNTQSIIQGLDGYPDFGGTNTTILYDLPATE